ncbi:MAG: methanogenesis marker protein Mmp4/MtxX, partial [archaeon]|nr:methanogenesis marker protein Mmp4/MtxX [archaeon]
MPQIAVGVGENKDILRACARFRRKNKNYTLKLIDNEADLINCFKDENIDAVIRGSLPSNKIMKEIKSIYTSNNILRATYVHDDEKQFLLSPVGIDEGNTLEEKYELAINCANFLKKIGKKPKIAILANGRKGDYGRSPEIDSSIDDAEELYSLLTEKTSYEVKNYYILIEQAIEEKANVIIAPDGIIGNIIFRTLILINKWPSYGAITFGTDKPYIDTSRNQVAEVYLRSLNLAKNLIEGYKVHIKDIQDISKLSSNEIKPLGLHNRLEYLCQFKKVMLSKDDVDYCINSGDKEASLIYNSVQLGSLITYYLHELGI